MKTNPANETTIKTPETITDEEVFRAIAKLSGGYRGRQVQYEIHTDEGCYPLLLCQPDGWTDAAGNWHEKAPDFLHSLDALLPVIRRLSFDSSLALHRRVCLLTSPRRVCLEILREVGHFDP